MFNVHFFYYKIERIRIKKNYKAIANDKVRRKHFLPSWVIQLNSLHELLPFSWLCEFCVWKIVLRWAGGTILLSYKVYVWIWNHHTSSIFLIYIRIVFFIICLHVEKVFALTRVALCILHYFNKNWIELILIWIISSKGEIFKIKLKE